MADQLEQPAQVSPEEPRRVSPGLILFLIFPLFGIAAALIVAITSTPTTESPPALAPAQQAAPRLLNFRAPDFALTSLENETVSLADYRGRVVFVNFWATWCAPCVEEMPILQAFHAEQGADGAVVLAVNAQETPDTIRDFLKRNAIASLPILLDPDNTAGRAYGIINMPTTFVVDPEGIVRFMKLGRLTRDDLYGYLDELSS